MADIQDYVFSAGEGDAWYRRNSNAVHSPDRGDWPLTLLNLYDRADEIRSVCEIGCSDGWRLARLANMLPSDAYLAGVDISREAIDAGCQRYPGLDLRVGMASEPPFNPGTGFHLVIVSFVFHWIDRSLFAKTLCAINNLVADEGILIVSDFLPDVPCRRRYHHRKDVELYTYKQDYSEAFCGLGFYEELARVTFHHADEAVKIVAAPPQDRALCSLLFKRVSNYQEV